MKSDNYFILKKSQIRLREDDNSNAYVQPSDASASSSSLSSDLAKAQSNNPTDDEFVINTKNYDGNSNNQPPTFDIKASNASDATKQYQKMMQNPQVRQINQTTGANVKIHLNNESIEYKRKYSIPFSKKELTNFLKSI
jgi:hypothetical protein